MSKSVDHDTRPSFALQVQLLASATQRVLVLGHAAGFRNGDRRFSPKQIDDLVQQLRLPPIANTNSVLARLRAANLAVSEGGGRWALTPLGDVEAEDLIAGLDISAIDAATALIPGAVFDKVEHKLLGPDFAPPRWAPGIARMLKRYPFENNVFCMTRFPKHEDDPVAKVIEVARDELPKHGLVLHLASDRQFEDDLLGNVGAYMWACKYGLGFLETRFTPDLNDNVMIELGSMIFAGRRCALLKDESAPNPPTDLAGQIYKPVDFDDLAAVRKAVKAWAVDDLGLT